MTLMATGRMCNPSRHIMYAVRVTILPYILRQVGNSPQHYRRDCNCVCMILETLDFAVNSDNLTSQDDVSLMVQKLSNKLL